jgi:large subunit ribosomal protein L29
MKAGDMREMSVEELNEQITNAKEELFRLRFRGATQELESPALVKSLRRDIARMKTILRERELNHG